MKLLKKIYIELKCIRLLFENYVAEQDMETYKAYIKDKKKNGVDV